MKLPKFFSKSQPPMAERLKRPELDEYQEHEREFTIKYFSHHLTELEQAIISSAEIFDERGGHLIRHIIIQDKFPPKIRMAAVEAIQEAENYWHRYQISQRVLAEHREEIYSASCPFCGKLPATPQAKICRWCKKSWFDEPEG